MAEDQPLHKDLIKRYQGAVEDHRYAVGLLQLRDAEITRLRGLLLFSNRQNKRLSRECQQVAQRLKDVKPEDSVLIDLLFPKN